MPYILCILKLLLNYGYLFISVKCRVTHIFVSRFLLQRRVTQCQHETVRIGPGLFGAFVIIVTLRSVRFYLAFMFLGLPSWVECVGYL